MVPHAHKSMPLKVFTLHFSVYSNSKHLQEEEWFRRFSHAPYHPLPTPMTWTGGRVEISKSISQTRRLTLTYTDGMVCPEFTLLLRGMT